MTAVVLPFRRIRQFQEAFALVGPGATVDEVIAVMGQPSQDIHGDTAATAWWDDKPIEPALAGKTRRTMRYVVPTFFVPVTFEFSFDEQGRAIGKHRYD